MELLELSKSTQSTYGLKSTQSTYGRSQGCNSWIAVQGSKERFASTSEVAGLWVECLGWELRLRLWEGNSEAAVRGARTREVLVEDVLLHPAPGARHLLRVRRRVVQPCSEAGSYLRLIDSYSRLIHSRI